MAMEITYASTVTFNSTTPVVWDNADGGPIRVQIVTNTNVVQPHVAGDFQVSDTALTSETVEVLVDLSMVTPASMPTKNDEQTLTLALKKSDNTNASLPLYRCKYVGLTNQEQSRDNPSASTARFAYNAGGTEKDIYTA
jgi:hypothetical protein